VLQSENAILNYSECLADCVEDCYNNPDNAQLLSQEVMKILERRLQMTSPEYDKIIDIFYDWLNSRGGKPFATWEERGLRADAPDEAKKAYAYFLEAEKEMRDNLTK
jgi:hypothetical protein